MKLLTAHVIYEMWDNDVLRQLHNFKDIFKVQSILIWSTKRMKSILEWENRQWIHGRCNPYILFEQAFKDWMKIKKTNGPLNAVEIYILVFKMHFYE